MHKGTTSVITPDHVSRPETPGFSPGSGSFAFYFRGMRFSGAV